MDADLQDDVNDLEKIMKKHIDCKDFVIGLRESRQHNLILIFITKVYDILIKFFFKLQAYYFNKRRARESIFYKH